MENYIVAAEPERIPFTPDRNRKDQSEHLVNRPNNYLTAADFCGLPEDVDKAIEYITLIHDKNHFWNIPKARELKPGVHGFTIWFCEEPQDNVALASIIQKAPNLKVAMFLECFDEYEVLLAYSRSGYPYITDVKVAGACDFHNEDRWTFHHTPTEASFRETVEYLSWDGDEDVNYRFPYLKDWEAMNFVFEKDGELFQMVSSDQSKKEETSPVSGPIAGKVFVVTGKLKHFAKRDDLKAIIQNNGAKLSESLNKDTHYLITNDPNSGSSKNQKARQLGIEVITEEEFLSLLGME